MNKSETPIDYVFKIKMGVFNITYFDSFEVCQGGPRVAHLAINDEPVPDYIFGGPLLEYDPFIFVPIFIFRSFRLARINCETLEVKILREERDVVFLEKIEDGKIFFFESFLTKVEHIYYELTDFDSIVPFHPKPYYKSFWRAFLDTFFPCKFFKDE